MSDQKATVSTMQGKTVQGSSHAIFSSRTKLVVGFAVAGLVIALPFFQSSVIVGFLIIAIAYAIALAGLNMVMGMSGVTSLAQSMFIAIGAYTSAMLINYGDWPFLLTVPVAAAIGLFVGLIVGLPTLRLRGMYLAVITFMVALVVPALIIKFKGVTGGANGMSVSKTMVPDVFLAADQWKYFIAVGIAALCLFMSHNLVHSSLGRSLLTLQANPIMAESLGIHVPRLRLFAFAWSGMLGSVGGTLIMLNDEFVAPQNFTFMISIYLLAGLVIGGVNRSAGFIIGGLFLVFTPQLIGGLGTGWVGVSYGLIMIVLLMVAPQGTAELLERFSKFIHSRIFQGRKTV